MSRVIDALREEHGNMAYLLDFLEGQVQVFSRAEEPDYVLVMDVIEYTLNYPDLYHHPNEDLIYEKLEVRDPTAAAKVGNLKSEHEKLADMTRRFAAAVENVLAEAAMPRDRVVHLAQEFIDATRRHMEMEEATFFPSALNSLTDEDWAEIDETSKMRPDPLFGAEVAESFKTLSNEIRRAASGSN